VRSPGRAGVKCASRIVSSHERPNRAIGAWSNDFICRRFATHTGVFH
jgi:hypothetical protein